MDDLISRQVAIDAFDGVKVDEENCTEYDIGYNDGIDFAISKLSVLSPAQLEQTNCDYCHEDVDGYVKPIEKNGHAFVRFGMNGWELELKAKGWHGETKIQYCPICGRKLKNDK